MKSILFLLCFSIFRFEVVHAQRSEVQGGTIFHGSNTPCLTDEQQQQIEEELKSNIASLRLAGKIPLELSRNNVVLFEFPMALNEGYDDYGFHAISNYMDNNSSSDIVDYNCGDRSYNGHRGIDYYLWPFSWNLVEADAVKAVAAAPGVIISKTDGHDHHSCALSSNTWNAVYLFHADGSTSWYGHLKMNSLTTKNVGESVEAGEYLGIIASSGNSTGPHLHFQVYDPVSNLVDPYAGDCNVFNDETWWQDQRPYIDPALNKIQTHFAPPDFPPCPEPEVTNESDQFQPGETVYFAVYLKDQQSNNVCLFSITEPDGQVFDAWTFSSPQPYFTLSYWYWFYTLPSDAPEGTWTFKCQFAGKLYTHEFAVGDVSSVLDNHPVFNKVIVLTDKDQITVKANCAEGSEGLIYLTDIHGRRLHQSAYSFIPGENRFNIPLRKELHGMYFVTLQSESYSGGYTTKVVIH